jgi:deazaflavin-dependent oxidoreductase (nitroreductase family)
MSSSNDLNDRDVIASSSYDPNNRNAFKKLVNELNASIIEEFRSNDGKVGGPFAGQNMLLLETIGAKSHQPRINPLDYMKDGDAIVVIASKRGSHTNPDWYHNILAHPEVWLEVGTERFKAHATIPERQERDRLFDNFVKQAPVFGEHQKNTSRILPVIVLKRV